MNFVSRNESQVVIRQVPLLAWLASGFLSLPLIIFGLVNIFLGAQADGTYFTLFAGLVLAWIFLEFAFPRQRITINLAANSLTRTVRGVFRHKQQVIDLSKMKGIKLELRSDNPSGGGRRYQHLLIYGGGGEHLLNSPSIMYLNHGKLGKLISDATGIPYHGRVNPIEI